MPRTRRLPPLSANRDNSRLDKIHTKKYNEVYENLLKQIKRNNEQESEIKRLTNLLKNSNSIIRSIRYILLQNN